MKINIKDVRRGTKYTGAYMKIFSKKFYEQAENGLMSEEEQIVFIDDLIDEIDNIKERLEIDGEHKPLRLLGLKATYDLMNQIYTGLFTLVLAVAQQVLS